MSFLALGALGAFHGINPGMGWLFAVALGLQERRAGAVWRSLIPLALGHALAVAGALVAAYLLGSLIPISHLRWLLAALLLAFGVYRLFRSSHPRYGGMRVNGRQLTIWSFLMASAHGAGLMVLPFVFGADTPATNLDSAPHAVHIEAHAHHVHATTAADAPHAEHVASLAHGLPQKPVVGLLAALVHTIGYLLITGLLAVVVYLKLGLRLLRTAWINLDLVWAGALIVTAVLTVLL